ncbi:MAG: sugar ABC transporter permease [Candidatus Limivivens sp.]|nr:sugar ABC transporter permease [Candidatus Limivivens sp.]
MQKTKKIWIFLFLLPTVILFLLVYLGPMALAAVTSFTKWNGMTPMKFIGLRNYVRIFQDPVFHAALKHTLIWALLAVVVHVPFGVLVALVLKRKRKGWRFVRAAFMVPNVISRAAISLMFVFIYKVDVGIVNTVLKSIGLEKYCTNWLTDPRTAFASVTNIWLWYAALITLITLSEIFSISSEIEESAKVDGASPLQIDLYIYLPLLKRIIGTGIIIAITAVFKEFESVYMTTNGGPGSSTMTISVMMLDKIIQSNQYGYANALGMLLLLMGVVAMAVCNGIFSMSESD